MTIFQDQCVYNFPLFPRLFTDLRQTFQALHKTTLTYSAIMLSYCSFQWSNIKLHGHSIHTRWHKHQTVQPPGSRCKTFHVWQICNNNYHEFTANSQSDRILDTFKHLQRYEQEWQRLLSYSIKGHGFCPTLCPTTHGLGQQHRQTLQLSIKNGHHWDVLELQNTEYYLLTASLC